MKKRTYVVSMEYKKEGADSFIDAVSEKEAAYLAKSFLANDIGCNIDDIKVVYVDLYDELVK